MKAVVTRPMKVLGDNGTLQTFIPSTNSDPYVEVSDATYLRLVRTGAAKPYQEKGEVEATKKRTRKATTKTESNQSGDTENTNNDPIIE